MKIVSVEESKSEIIVTDSDEYPVYRRYSSGSWENLMGCSWEDVYNIDEIEKIYQEYMRGQVIANREEISDLYGELCFLDPPEVFDDCILGVSQNCAGDTYIAYSYMKCIEKLKLDMSEEEAIDYFAFNIIGSYVGGTFSLLYL